MQCWKCGNEIKADVRFCPNCGEKIGDSETVSMGERGKFTWKKAVVIAVCLLVIAFIVKMVSKSDSERLVGTWVLVSRVSMGEERIIDEEKEVIFGEGDAIYDEDRALKGILDSYEVISWKIIRDGTLMFTDEWLYQYTVDYELSGNTLRLIDTDKDDCYSIWKKR